jgi:hypothetical protein
MVHLRRGLRPLAPASLPPVGVRGCLSAEVECDGAALASCSISICECAGCAARIRGGSQAHPLPSCPPAVARLAVHARSHSMAPNERSRAGTVANTPLARRLRETNPARPALPPHGHQACVRTPNVARTRLHTPVQPSGSKRFLCMTCIEWVVKPAAAMTSRIW